MDDPENFIFFVIGSARISLHKHFEDIPPRIQTIFSENYLYIFPHVNIPHVVGVIHGRLSPKDHEPIQHQERESSAHANLTR